jgi:hypothetical protein
VSIIAGAAWRLSLDIPKEYVVFKHFMLLFKVVPSRGIIPFSKRKSGYVPVVSFAEIWN